MDIVLSIQSGEYDAQLDRITQAVQDRRQTLGQRLIRTLRIGARVETTKPMKDRWVGLKGTVSEVLQTRVEVLFDRDQRVGTKHDLQIAAGIPLTVQARCLRVMEDQSPAQEPKGTVNGAVVTEIPFMFNNTPPRYRRSRRGEY